MAFPDLWSGQKPCWNWCLTLVANFGDVRRGSWPNPHSSSKLVHLGSFWSIKVSSDAKQRVGCGKQREVIARIESPVKLQPWFLSLRWKICLRQNWSLGSYACSEGPAIGQTTLIIIYIYIYSLLVFLVVISQYFRYELQGLQ